MLTRLIRPIRSLPKTTRQHPLLFCSSYVPDGSLRNNPARQEGSRTRNGNGTCDKRELKKLNETMLSRHFARYSVDNMDFIEETTLRCSTSPQAEIQGNVSFSNQDESAIPQERGIAQFV